MRNSNLSFLATIPLSDKPVFALRPKSPDSTPNFNIHLLTFGSQTHATLRATSSDIIDGQKPGRRLENIPTFHPRDLTKNLGVYPYR